MKVFDENPVVFSTDEIKAEQSVAEENSIEESSIDISEPDTDSSEPTDEDSVKAEEIVTSEGELNGQKFVNSSDAYGYFDEETDQGIIDQHEAYARQGRNQEYYRDPTYHNVRRNYENREYYDKGNRGRYPYGDRNGSYGGNGAYQRPRYNDVYAKDNTRPDGVIENTATSGESGYSDRPKYYTDDRRETGRDVARTYNDGIPVYTGRKSRQYETVGAIIRILDLAGFKLGDRLVLIDKETGEVLR